MNRVNVWLQGVVDFEGPKMANPELLELNLARLVMWQNKLNAHEPERFCVRCDLSRI